MKKLIFYIILFSTFSNCNTKQKDTATINESYLQENCLEKLNEVIVHDIYSPPVASRIYAYCNLAFYEAIKYSSPNSTSITNKMKLYSRMPTTIDTTLNFSLSAVSAFFSTAKVLCFSKDSVNNKLNVYLDFYRGKLSKNVFEESVKFGDSIAKIILARATNDNYKLIKGLPKYSVVKEKNTWEQTPPDYMDAVEPNWFKLVPMLIDSSLYECTPPPAYNENKISQYYTEVLEVFETSKIKTASMDSIAKYWDDNPYVTEHKGHFVAATKKITPVGHWLGITGIICKKNNATILNTAKIYALTSCAMYDGFIACWFQKYKTKMPRPVSIIRKWFNPNWNAYLQTPPFPEYTSGHSVVSNAAATLLGMVFKDTIPFIDSTENKYLGMQRNFITVSQAADEAGKSRLYGGIHFRSAIENGKQQGNKIGKYYCDVIK